MGGLAIGSALAARFSVRWSEVLLGYAIVEAVIGMMALAFHHAFVGITEASFAHVIPALGSASAVQVYKWGLGAAMILPQSVLLGMTFPLMTAAFLRFSPLRTGRSVALLYFTNSAGGALGILASGFLLIPRVGLPGTILTAGLLNFAVALFSWLVVRAGSAASKGGALPEAPDASATAAADGGMSYRLLLAASLVTGVASFCYEIGWIRMLVMVLGASTHAFEIMVSSFILGLALGGLAVSRHIDRAPDPRALLAYVQLAMAVLALSTLLLYGSTFEWMEQVFNIFSKTDAGYSGFNLASHLIASAIMLPATFCAGMTLPIITHAALRGGVGERAVGGIYAANTIGAIAGVVLATHVLMPVFNAKGVIVAGAAIDFALGLALMRGGAPTLRTSRLAVAAAVGIVAFPLAILAGNVDPLKVTSSVFRYGAARSTQDEVLYLKDGKTANVSLMRKGKQIALATNGKVDAAINMGAGPPGRDEVTQLLLGALPLMLRPHPQTAAVIGFGSGVTTHVLLADSGLERVDTVEIESRMVEAARRGFYPRNRLAYDDPRSHVHIEDAKTYFSMSGRTYDIIVSEPSNPWVSGVSSLFTEEFYRRITRHLREGGVLVQWVQLYEIDFAAIASVMKAMSPSFEDYAVYVADGMNIIVVARRGAKLGALDGHIFGLTDLRDQLRHVFVNKPDDVRAVEVGRKAVLDPYFGASRAPANSDYFPFMDNRAVRARYLGLSAAEPMQLLAAELPIAEMLADDRDDSTWAALTIQNPSDRGLGQLAIRGVMDGLDDAVLMQMRLPVAVVRSGARDCGAQAPRSWESSWMAVARFAARYVDADKRRLFWGQLVPEHCRGRLSARSRLSLELFEAVSAKDAIGMVRLGGQLLATADPQFASRDTQYAAAALVLGRLALGQTGEAAEVFGELPKHLQAGTEPSTEMRWLEAITARRMANR
ncbi:MAG TPA: hypothetical protein VFV71_04905 [Burkholderiales bacterium]|nr:hypothetical protein [Burkholderiales bacterium]